MAFLKRTKTIDAQKNLFERFDRKEDEPVLRDEKGNDILEGFLTYLKEKEFRYTALICNREDYLEIGNQIEEKLWKEKISYQTIISEDISLDRKNEDEETWIRKIENELESVEVLVYIIDRKKQDLFLERNCIASACEKIALKRRIDTWAFDK